MRKIILTEWVTLDGFTAGPNNDMGFVGESFNDEMGKYEYDIVSSADTLILGRVTYDSFAGAWPAREKDPATSEGERVYAKMLNSMRKIVFSKTLKKADWNNSILYKEINPKEIAKVKREKGKNILIYGSASIVQQLTNLRLIDEYQLLVHPVVLGAGKQLFKDIKEKRKLHLVSAKSFTSGVVLLTYSLRSDTR